MKKLLFLLPIIILFLNLLPLSIFHQTVRSTDIIGSNGLIQLQPTSWKAKKLTFAATASVTRSVALSGNAGYIPAGLSIVTQGAKFHGFPFAFYFNNSNLPRSSGLDLISGVSALSVRWLIMDVLIWIALVVVTGLYYFLTTRSARRMKNVPKRGHEPEVIHPAATD